MLNIHVPKQEVWNESRQEFVYINEQTIIMEHSLISIAKWEEKHKKVFLSKEEKTPEELFDYYKCMCINKVDDDVFTVLTRKDYISIKEYMEDPMIPFNFRETKEVKKKGPGDPFCAIMIYYYMTVAQIPFTCEKWHINKLLALLKIYGLKNSKPEKMTAAERSALNMERRKKFNSKG